MPITELMTDYIACARTGDWETAYGFFADDIVIRIPGRSAMAGEHRGRAAARDYIDSARSLSTDHEVEVDVLDLLVSDERAALLVLERFHGPDGPTEIRRCNVYRWEDERIAEIWIFEADQYAMDALFTG
jgi:ketosteroid isomerase-like protein